MDGAWNSHPQMTNPLVIENKLNAVQLRECPSNFFSGRFLRFFRVRFVVDMNEHQKIYIVTDDGLKRQKEGNKRKWTTIKWLEIPFQCISSQKAFCNENLWTKRAQRDFPSWLPFPLMHFSISVTHISIESVWLRVIEAFRFINIYRRLKSLQKESKIVNQTEMNL